MTQAELSDAHPAAIATERSRHLVTSLGKAGGDHG